MTSEQLAENAIEFIETSIFTRQIKALATDDEITTTLPKFPLNDVSAIADFVMNYLQLQERPC